jgi:predicted nucleic acid-binding protein
MFHLFRTIPSYDQPLSKDVVHVSAAEAASNLTLLLDRVSAGVEVVIEKDSRPVAVVRAPEAPRGRLLSESIALAVTVFELTHGIYRAKSEIDAERRRVFVDELCQAVIVQPVTLEIAQLAGRIEGEQAAKGVVIALPDLLIGVTALHLGYAVATLNLRHFGFIPGPSVIHP